MGGLSTRGNKIINQSGEVVHFNGISWFGAESGIYVPHGLWQRPMDSMLDQVKALGYNLLRIPYSNEMLTKTASDITQGLDFNQNPDLKGLSPLLILDVFIKKAEARGIYILLDRHQYQSGGSNGDNWVSWDQAIGEDKWINDWVMLANMCKDRTNIFGADLANEPHTTAVTWPNWVAAATKCGNAILEFAPNWLIVVEGIEVYNNNWFWWGGQLEGVKDLGVQLATPNKVVYSAHDYGPGVYNQSWFQDPTFPANLPNVWDTHFGYIAKQNIAPVLIGEFGGKETDTASAEGKWQNALVDYIKANDLYFTYWCLNPDSGDTGGVLQDDWVTVNTDKQTMLQRLFQPLTQPTTTQPTTTPEVPQTPATPPAVTPQPQPTPTPTTPAATPSTPAPVPGSAAVSKLVLSFGEIVIICMLCAMIGLFSGALSMWIALH